jgi:hypothetical protein
MDVTSDGSESNRRSDGMDQEVMEGVMDVTSDGSESNRMSNKRY